MNGKVKSRPLCEDDGPFAYVYLAITAVPGMRLPEDAGPRVPFFSFPMLNAEAFLTSDWDPHCVHMDRSNAIAFLMLTGFLGHAKFGRLSIYWNRLLNHLVGADTMFRRRLNREADAVRKQRHDAHKTPGCYLIYRAEGNLIEPIQLNATRRIGNIGFGFDVVCGDQYRKVHKTALHTTATALSLALVETTGSPDTHFIGDIIFLTGSGDLTVYSRHIQGGMAALVTSSRYNSESLRAAERYIPAMIDDHRIEMAISLFVQSQNPENDNLRSFIAAWSALELVVNRLSKITRSEWDSVLRREALPKWDKDLSDVRPEEYRMRDRFYSVACVLDLGSASADLETFIRVNDMRSGFYHRMEVLDRDLPTEDVRRLFRKYLKLGLLYDAKCSDKSADRGQ